MPGQINEVDILIMSQFNAAGFMQARESIAQLNGTMGKMASGFTLISDGFGQISKSVSQTGNAYKDFVNNTGLVSSATSKMANDTIKDFYNMGNSVKDFNAIGTSTTSSVSDETSNMGAVTQQTASKMGTAFNSMKSYMGSVIKQSISVGDIFGYYIGMTALQAVYDLTIGLSSMRQEMETTFEYMGNSTSEVTAFSQNLTDWAVKMPKISIAGAYEMARVQAMAGNSLPAIEKWKQTWGDIQAIGASMLGVSPEAAASKVGPAIDEAVEGRLKRITTLTGITTTRFKAKAAEMGISADQLTGNYDNTMKVLQALLQEENLAGISGKLTSFADAWDYMSESIAGTTSNAMNGVVGEFSPLIIALGNAIQAIPAPMMLMMLGFVGFVAAILVGMPIIAALVSSFSIVRAVFAPVISGFTKMGMGLKGFSTTAKTELAEVESAFEKFDAEQLALGNKPQKTQTLDVGGKQVVRQMGTELGDTGKMEATSTYFTKTDTQAKKLDKSIENLNNRFRSFGSEAESLGSRLSTTSTYTGALSSKMDGVSNSVNGFKNKVGLAGSELSGFGGRLKSAGTEGVGLRGKLSALESEFSSLGGRMRGVSSDATYLGSNIQKATPTSAPGRLAGLKNSFTGLGLGGRLAGSGIGTAGKAMMGFMLTDPIGWILLIVMALVAVFQATGSWGKVTKDLGAIWAKLSAVLIPVINQIITLTEQAYSGASAWDGWKPIMQYLTQAWTNLVKTCQLVYIALEPLMRIKMNPAFADASRQLSSAWYQVQQALGEAYTSIKPSLDDLMKTFGDLWNALAPLVGVTNQASTGLDKAGASGKGASQGFNPVYTIIKIIVDVIKIFAWIITTVVVPAIKIFTFVFTGVVFMIKNAILVITFMVNAWKAFDKALKPIGGAMALLAAPFGIVIAAVQLLWHWITGNSPGLMPAFSDLLDLATSVFPTIETIITTAINNAINIISSFVTNAVAFFESLPGKIGQALTSLGSTITTELQNAYNGAMSWVKNFVNIGSSIKDAVVNGIKGALGIQSPSKVTYSLGEAISQGLLNGMTDWVKSNATSFVGSATGGLLDSLKQLQNRFANFQFKMYYNSLQGVSETLRTMSGNCSDAADAFMSLATQAGIATEKVHTSVNGIGHYVVKLPTMGMWIDPSGIMGKGYQALGTQGISGAPNIAVTIQQPTIKEDKDSKKLANEMVRQVLNAVRFGI